MDEECIQLITGPNMREVTYMRHQIIVILAQIGSYVPAQKAEHLMRFT